MSLQRHILWGAIVGVSVAVAFNAILTLQFDETLSIGLVLMELPICAILGAVAGWIWWRFLGR